jgi:hypothetical protein
MKPVPRLLIAHAALVLVFVGCRAEEPRQTDATAAAAPPPPASGNRGDAPRGAELVATGRQSFRGSPRYQCVLHDDRGVQINLRTGDPALPVVTVRLEDYQGTGSYSARLFVTGRSGSGALVRSQGVADLELRGSEPSGPAEAIVLSGTFEGTYGGEAGKGSVEGRFSGCSYRQVRGGPPILADSNL